MSKRIYPDAAVFASADRKSLSQASRILADLQGLSAHNSQGLLAAKRRLAYAGLLHRRLGSMCTELGCARR